MLNEIKSDAMNLNQQILESIAKNGILPKSYLENNNFYYQGSRDGVQHQSRQINYISVNAINQPAFELANWIDKVVKHIVHSPAVGIYPVLIERDHKENEFYNFPKECFQDEITQRIRNSVLFALDPEKLPISDEKGIGRNAILEPFYNPCCEKFLDKPISPGAINHVFIPNAIKEIAEPIFSKYPITFIPETTQSLLITIPQKIEVNEELLEEPIFFKSRSAKIEIPDYEKVLSNFVHNYFENRETEKPLVFHFTRLTTEWLTSQ